MEFIINGFQYRAGKLSAFEQLHVSRKIAPIIPTLVPLFVEIAQSSNWQKDIGKLAPLLQPFADGLANLSDADSEYILATCMGTVQRLQGDNWTPVWSKSAGCMFDDIDLGIMIQIAMKVIQDSLAPFIRGLLTSQQAI